MIDNKSQLLEQAQAFVTDLFRSKVDPKFLFHNLDHTQQVVNAAIEIAGHYGLNDDDRLVLLDRKSVV